MPSKVSYRDIAERANVSTATVSRVARAQATVDPAIRERVEKAAAELGVDIEQRRHEDRGVVAFLLSNRDILHAFQARILLGAERYCSLHERELLFMTFRYSPNAAPREIHLPRILNKSLVRAVILGGVNSGNMLEALRLRGMPFSVLGNNVIGEWNPSEHDVVYSDDIQGAYDLTARLIADGHRRIYFIGNVDLPWYARCAMGYRKAMSEAGLEPAMSNIHSDGHQLGYLAMRSLLSDREQVTAVFAGSDPIARGAYDAVRQCRLRIPEDISIAGFNDTEASLMYPPLTTVREFPEELGHHLAEIVLRRVKCREGEPRQLTIPTQLIVRESTRPLSGGAIEIGAA